MKKERKREIEGKRKEGKREKKTENDSQTALGRSLWCLGDRCRDTGTTQTTPASLCHCWSRYFF